MGLVYSQILRYRRIISDGQRFRKRVERLRVSLLARGYRDSHILPAVDWASSWTQSQLLLPKEKNHISVLPFDTPYDPNLHQLTHILRQHWSYINNDQLLSQLFPSPPMVAYQRHRNLKEEFVHHSKFWKLYHQHITCWDNTYTFLGLFMEFFLRRYQEGFHLLYYTYIYIFQ